jgi:deoxyribonuclease-4
MYLGVHVSISGKIADSIDRAASLGCTAMQIFSRNPRQWRSLNLTSEDAAEFRRRRKDSGIGAVAVHVPYLINLATSYDVLYRKSVQAYIEDIREAHRLGAEYFVTHMGSYKNSTLPAGVAQFIKALDEIFEATKGIKVRLLLENTAGSGHWLGATFEHHRRIFEGVKDSSRLGVCLDTAHLFGAGFDIRKPDVFDKVIVDIETKLGKRALKVVHLNDSAAGLGSLADHHAHIGKGEIGLKSFKHIVNHPGLRDAALILETPKDTPRADRMNLSRVRKLIKTENS